MGTELLPRSNVKLTQELWTLVTKTVALTQVQALAPTQSKFGKYFLTRFKVCLGFGPGCPSGFVSMSELVLSI